MNAIAKQQALRDPADASIDRVLDMMGEDGVAAMRPGAAPWRFTSPADLEGKPVTQRKWVVPDWVPMGAVTLLYGNGGAGKSLLTQQLMTCCATGRPWLGIDVARCGSLAVFAEDDDAELHRRQLRINAPLGIGFGELHTMRWVASVGTDNELARFLADGTIFYTDRLGELERELGESGAGLLIIDTVAKSFGGDPNDGRQVDAFISALTVMAQQCNVAVLITAHPSRHGMGRDGDGDGGSVAWSNAARSRLFLEHKSKVPGGLILSRRKSNYAAPGASLHLHYADGVIEAVAAPSANAVRQRDQAADSAFLGQLRQASEMGENCSMATAARSYAPRIFSPRTEFSVPELADAMRRLMAAGKIRNCEYGRAGGSGAKPRRIEVAP